MNHLAWFVDCPECGGQIEVIGRTRMDPDGLVVDLVALMPFHDCDLPVPPLARGGHGAHP